MAPIHPENPKPGQPLRPHYCAVIIPGAAAIEGPIAPGHWQIEQVMGPPDRTPLGFRLPAKFNAAAYTPALRYFEFQPMRGITIHYLMIVRGKGNELAQLFADTGARALPLTVLAGQRLEFSIERPEDQIECAWVFGEEA